MESCDRYLELLSQSLDGPLSELEQNALQAHLEICPDCRLLAQQLAQIHGELSTWEDHPVPEGFTPGVMDQIRALNDTPKNIVPLWKRPQFKALGSVAACAVLCLGLWGSGILSGSTAMDGSVEMAAAAKGVSAASTECATAVPAAVADQVSPAETFEQLYCEDTADYVVSRSQSESTIPDEEELLQLAERLTGVQPGCLMVVTDIPGTMKAQGELFCDEGFSFFLFDTLPSQSEQQELLDKAIQQSGPISLPLVVLVTG